MTNFDTTDAVEPTALARFDLLIDVRSPGEFAEDHIPGAVNLPVLSDEERAEVGTLYVQQSRLLARRIGAAYVARNIARHLETALADRPGAFQPLVYCWRGGQRSSAMATVLSQVGWRPVQLVGGYKTYRRRVQAHLYGEAEGPNLVLLDGRTGVAKTEILGRLAALGVQTLDLEGLAAHRGSLFGALPGRPQPSQKLFESRLLAALDGLDLSRPIVVEAESSKIGERMTPPWIWAAMRRAPRIELRADLAARAGYLAAVYGEVAENPPALKAILDRLPVHPGRKQVAALSDLAEAGATEALAAVLMETHYDPAYDRSSRKAERPPLAVIDLPDLSAASQGAAATEIAGLVAGLG